jgi:hypothetical protein
MEPSEQQSSTNNLTTIMLGGFNEWMGELSKFRQFSRTKFDGSTRIGTVDVEGKPHRAIILKDSIMGDRLAIPPQDLKEEFHDSKEKKVRISIDACNLKNIEWILEQQAQEIPITPRTVTPSSLHPQASKPSTTQRTFDNSDWDTTLPISQELKARYQAMHVDPGNQRQRSTGELLLKLRKLEHWNGKTYGTPYLGPEEKLAPLLQADDKTVSDHGTTHNEIATTLESLIEKAMAKEDTPGYQLSVEKWRGSEEPPLKNVRSACRDIIIKKDDEEIEFSEMMPDLIRNYGFYGGRNTPYRFDPDKLIRFSGIERSSRVGLLSSEVATGQSSTVSQSATVRKAESVGLALEAERPGSSSAAPENPHPSAPDVTHNLLARTPNVDVIEQQQDQSAGSGNVTPPTKNLKRVLKSADGRVPGDAGDVRKKNVLGKVLDTAKSLSCFRR